MAFEDEGHAREREGALELPRLLAELRASWLWIAIPTLAGLGLAFLFVSIVTPRYTGITKVLLETQDSYFTRPDKATADPTSPLDPEGVESQVEVVRNGDLARSVIDKLGLARTADYAASDGLLGALLGERSTGDPGDRLVEIFLNKLNVFAVTKTRVLQIEFTNSDPALAARGANEVAALYLDQQEAANVREAKVAASWLATKIEELRTKVAEADEKAETLRASAGLLPGANGLTVPNQQLAEINSQIAAARAQQSAATAKAQLLRDMLRTGRLDSVPDVARDESLRRYAEQRVTLKAEIAEQARTLLPGHPHMKELAGQLAGLDQEIQDAAQKAVRGLEDEAQLAGTQVKQLQAAINAQAKAVASSDPEQVQLRALDLESKSLRDQLESYLGKYREALARDADNATPPNARVIAPALAPRSPSFPKKLPTILLAGLAGLFLSAGTVIARALLSEPAGAAAVPPKAVSAEAEFEPLPRGAPGNRTRGRAAAGSIEAAVDEIVAQLGDDDALTFLVCGAGTPQALSAALVAARRLSRDGSCVLVDLGASQSWFTDAIDRSGEPAGELTGLSDLLARGLDFDRVRHRDLSSDVEIVLPGSGEIEPESLPPVIEALVENYRFVVVHASDWRSAAAREILPVIVAVALCAPQERLAGDLKRLRAALPDAQIVTLGVALDSDSRAVAAA